MLLSNKSSDAELLDLMRSDDKEAFSMLYNRYWEDLLNYCYRISQDREICMDILQDVFVWFWNNRTSLNITSVKAYLFTAVKYQIANHIRRAKIRETYISKEKLYLVLNHQEETLFEAKELLQHIKHFSALMPPRRKEIFELSRFEYLTNKEIAEKLNISEKTVEMHITLALNDLKSNLEGYYIFFIFFL